MSDEPNDQERPCLHCMMVELIDDFFAEYPATPGVSDKVDTGEADEVIVATGKDGRGTNQPPRWYDPPATDRTVDA